MRTSPLATERPRKCCVRDGFVAGFEEWASEMFYNAALIKPYIEQGRCARGCHVHVGEAIQRVCQTLRHRVPRRLATRREVYKQRLPLAVELPELLRAEVCLGRRALVLRGRGNWFRELEIEFGGIRSDRPEPWYPYVFSSPADAVASGLCGLK